jgi:hypothetical protein
MVFTVVMYYVLRGKYCVLYVDWSPGPVPVQGGAVGPGDWTGTKIEPGRKP